MKLSRVWLCSAIFLCFSSAAAERSATTAFTFTMIDFPGAACTQVLGINDSGHIVGDYQPVCGALPVHGFLLDKGTFTSFDVPGANFTQPSAINASGEITGFCEGDGCVIGSGFLRGKRGNINLFKFPGSCSTLPSGISHSVQIVGSYSFTCSGSNHGFLFAGGSFSTIDFPGSAPPAGSTEALGNNNAGDIVGTYGIAGPFVENHGYLFSGGGFTTIDVPFAGTIRTRAEGINDPQTIVELYEDATGVHGFMLAGGTFTTIDVPGAVSTTALKVNNSGHIVGNYQDGAGRFHGFLATP